MLDWFVGLESLRPADGDEGVQGKVVLITGGAKRADCLVATVVEYAERRRLVELVLPYRPAAAPGGFTIHRLKLTRVEGVDEEELDGLGDAFMRGVRRFPLGAALWAKTADPRC